MLNAEFPSDFVGPLQPGDTRPMPGETPASTGTKTTPAAITAWSDAIFGTARKGAETYQTVKDTVTGETRVVPVTTRGKDNTLLYIGVGLAALFVLGGGTYLLIKRKGR